LDVGHAFAACALSAAFQGWHISVISGVSDAVLRKLLGLTPELYIHEAEIENPALLAIVMPEQKEISFEFSEKFLQKIENLKWEGKPNSLSWAHVSWPIVKEITQVTEKVLPIIN
jgi:hypothetical protein